MSAEMVDASRAAGVRWPVRARRWSARSIDSGPVLGAIGVLAFLVVWQAIGSSGLISSRDISSPLGAAGAGWDMLVSGELWTNMKASLTAFFVGLGLAVVVGVPLGLVMGWNQVVRRLTEPPIMALYVTPYLAFLPVLVVWLGIGNGVKVAVVFIAAFVPVVINAIAGIRNVEPLMVRVGRSFGASRLQLFGRILLPASTPSIVTGIRLAVGRAVLGVVVAELYVSVLGIGHLITTYGAANRTDNIVFLVIAVGVFGYIVSALVGLVERRLESWRAA